MDSTPEVPQTIVDMSSFTRDTGFSALAQVEGYWDALRGARLMPKRAEIDPRGIEAALDYTRVKAVWLRTSDEPIPDPFVMR